MRAIHFTPDDLRRITIARRPPTMVELVFGARLLGSAERDTPHRLWRNAVTTRLTDQAKPICQLSRQRRYLPDFLFPPIDDPLAAIDAVTGTPTADLRAELETLNRFQPLPTWARDLADGQAAARRTLQSTLLSFRKQALLPYWEHITARVSADRTVRAHVLVNGGIDLLLATLHPALQWRPPVLWLTAPGPSETATRVDLNGRGLLLIPSEFAQGPIFGDVPTGTPALVYPATPLEPTTTDNSLAALLGTTRATVLTALKTPATTTQLAHRTGISLPSTSQHTTVLRNAGLITTTRLGPAVLHTLTPLGTKLLNNT